MHKFQAMPPKRRPSLNDIAAKLRKKNKKWSVQAGKNKGATWSAKQIGTFMQKRLATRLGTEDHAWQVALGRRRARAHALARLILHL